MFKFKTMLKTLFSSAQMVATMVNLNALNFSVLMMREDQINWVHLFSRDQRRHVMVETLLRCLKISLVSILIRKEQLPMASF